MYIYKDLDIGINVAHHNLKLYTYRRNKGNVLFNNSLGTFYSV